MDEAQTAARAQAIVDFATAARLTWKQLDRAPTLSQLADTCMARKGENRTPRAMTLKELEASLEQIRAGQTRRRTGAVYTPTYIIDEIVGTSLSLAHGRPASLLDPACGAGGFLVGAATTLAGVFDVSFQSIVEEVLCGIDIDPVAIEDANAMLELLLLLRGENPACHRRLFVADALLTDKEELLRILDAPAGVSMITTNPPYVRLQSLETEYRNALLGAFDGLASGSFSLAPLFLVRSHELLESNGIAGFITQNNLFTSLAGENVRRYMQERFALRQICNFNHAKVFANASAYTCLLFLGSSESETFRYGQLYRPHPTTLPAVDYSTLQTSQLNAKKWRLAPQRHLENLERIEGMPANLGDLGEIRVGFATLKDSVFVVDVVNGEAVVRDGTRLERGSWRYCTKVADLRDRWLVPEPSRAVIFPYEWDGSRYRVVSEEVLRSVYPNTYEHLASCRKSLESREKGRVNGEAWFAWGRRQSLDAPGPKLLTKTFDSSPGFALDESDALFCNGYSVRVRQDRTLFADSFPGLGLLQHILNSDIMEYYARLTSFQIEGNYQCYQKNFIEKFGIPKLTKSELALLEESQNDEREFSARLANIYGIDYSNELEPVLAQGRGN